MTGITPIDTEEKTDHINDTRKKVQDTLDFPYSAIGLLSLKYNQKSFSGTGFLVGPNIVLTAAHNLYDHTLKMECT